MLEQIQHPGPIAVVLCGMPGAGKSTASGSFFENYVYLSTDAEIEVVAEWSGKTYDDVFAEQIGHATATVNDEFRRATRNGWSFVWDQTNLTVKKRSKILSQLPKDYYKICVVVQTDDETRNARLLARVGKTVPPHILKSMKESFVMPTIEEGFDLVKVINT